MKAYTKLTCLAVSIGLQIGIAWSSTLAAPSYTYVDLVNMLRDLERLAVLPLAGERSAEWTSMDRAANYSAGTDQYSNWGANGDGTGFIGDNGDGGRIMAQMQGPGCIWRIWTARPNSGHVKIFLDDSPTPIVDLPFTEYFNHSQTAFAYSSLAYEAAGGYDSYIPIPFEKSCKVVAYDDWGLYYHIGYTLFLQGTTVPTYTPNISAEENAALARLDRFFTDSLGADPVGMRAGQIIDSSSISIDAGQSVTLKECTGQGAITGIRIKVNDLTSKSEQWAALRELALSMYWDGENAPAVWAPLGDFFGGACGYTPFKALPVGKLEDGWMYCYWYMPFSSGARVVIKNDGSTKRTLEKVIISAPLNKPLGSLGRFHAKWNRNAQQPTRTDRWPDYTVLKTTGSGRFLGFMLHLYKPNDISDPLSPPGEYWWGEGDEKFFVDGERFPSWFGTGSEDYFGYAWATPDYFSRPFHSQVYNEGGIHMRGNRCLNRFQISDNVPFQTAFEGCIEKYHSDDYARYSVMPYWYLASGGNDPYGEVSLAERTGYYEAPQPRDTNLIEGEDLTIVSQSHGSLVVQDMAPFGGGWSNNKQLLWFKNNLSDVGQGSHAVLSFPVKSSGTYAVKGVLTKAGDYGTLQFSIDGVSIGDPFDGYNNGVSRSSEVTFGNCDLTAGMHQLGVKVVGKNSASGGYYSGLDYLRLVLIAVKNVPRTISADALPLSIRVTCQSRFIRFVTSPSIRQIEIYDLSGTLVRNVEVVNGEAFWQKIPASGRYIARAKAKGITINTPFIIVN